MYVCIYIYRKKGRGEGGMKEPKDLGCVAIVVECLQGPGSKPQYQEKRRNLGEAT
jgi:hypothetical protein